MGLVFGLDHTWMSQCQSFVDTAQVCICERQTEEAYSGKR